MYGAKRSWQPVFTLWVLLSLVVTSLPARVGAQPPPEPTPGEGPLPVRLSESQVTVDAVVTYRVQVRLQGSRDLARLQSLGVTLLDQQADTATVLASEGQLEDLARLRFQPQGAG